MPTTVTTERGLRVLVEELPHTHSVSIGSFAGVGACYEATMLSGVSHFIEHMCFKGTHGFPHPRLISLAVEGVGGFLNASTGYESTVYWAKVADIHFHRALKVVTELLCYPLFDPHDLEKERRVIIEEIRGLQDTPSEWVHTLLQQTMWGNQPFGRDIAGSVESVSALRHADLVSFWNQYYDLDNIVVSVAGNVQTERVIEAVTAAFSQLENRLASPASPAGAAARRQAGKALLVHPPQPGPQVTLLRRDTEQGNFCIGFPAFSYRDPDRRALQVLDTVVGGGMSSRLFQTLREDLGLAYSIGSYQTELSETGMWVIYGSVEADMLRDTVGATLDILYDVLQNGVTSEELDRVKEQVKGGILLSLEDTWAVASRNGAHQLRYNEVMPVERVVAEVEAVTHEAVLQVAQRVICPDAMHMAVIGPYGEDDEADLRALLEYGR